MKICVKNAEKSFFFYEIQFTLTDHLNRNPSLKLYVHIESGQFKFGKRAENIFLGFIFFFKAFH